MSHIPLISICIPSFRRPVEIQETIQSIVSQFDDSINEDTIEIIISDDAWSDVEEVIRPLIKKYSCIHYFRNEKNLRFANWLQANSLWKWKYLLSLSNDDSLTNFSLKYLKEIIEATDFDFLLHKPFFTADVHIPVEKKENTYQLCYWVKDYITTLYKREKSYNGLVSYFSFNSVMVVKASYRHEWYQKIDREKVFTNEFPQEFPPYFDLRDKKIVLTDATFLKWRLLNACYSGSLKLIHSFQEMMDFIEKQNDLSELDERKKIKKICIWWRNRTMYIWIILAFLKLDYKKTGWIRSLYNTFKKHIQ